MVPKPQVANRTFARDCRYLISPKTCLKCSVTPMDKDVLAIEEKLNLLVDASSALLRSVHQEEPAPSILAMARRLNSSDACALWRFDFTASVWRIAASLGVSED